MDCNGELVGEHQGYKIYFLHISYSCPALKLRGYSTDLALTRAINRVIKKRESLTSRNA